MDINASIVDQRLDGLLESYASELSGFIGADKQRQKSLAFVLLCVMTSLDMPFTEALELATEGGGDLGIDALHLSELDDGEFTVTIFQGKYTHKNLEAESAFPENSIKALLLLLSSIFDPSKTLSMNSRLAPRIEEIRSLIRDGFIPNVHVMLCNNGKKWKTEAQEWIDQSGFSESRVQWQHYNHNNIVKVLQRTKAVNDSLVLTGTASIENFNFKRVLIGKVSVLEIAKLFDNNGDLLLERNIRRYLGRNTNRVNSAIHQTLVDSSKQKDFYFFNNGITMTCTKFRQSGLSDKGGENLQLKLENIQVINGGQTCKTIQQTLAEIESSELTQFSEVFVLLRLYELEEDDDHLVKEITFATNSQNPVDLRDLRSNDALQVQLELGVADLGYEYKRYKDDTTTSSNVITSAITAEAVMAIWRRMPHINKLRRRELFGAYYQQVFEQLNAAQAVLAVLIFRMVENERKRPVILADKPVFLPYAAHFMAMLIGDELLQEKSISLSDVSHRNFSGLVAYLEQNKRTLITNAAEKIDKALVDIYGDRDVSLQQLSATFRRGDLLEFLN